MKKILSIMLLSALLLGGCAQSEYDMRPTYSHLKIAGYMEDDRYGYDEAFLALQERVQEGETPGSVTVTGESIRETLTEETPICDLWNTVTGYYVATDACKPGEPCEELIFRFMWEDKEEYLFTFVPDGEDYLFVDVNDTYHRVSTPGETIDPTLELIEDYLAQPEGERVWMTLEEKTALDHANDPVPVDQFDWDADADGEAEHFKLEFKEHRDGLSGDLWVKMYKEGKIVDTTMFETDGYIYNLREGNDERGNYLLFDYDVSYYMEEYLIKDTMTGVLRYEDGALFREFPTEEML